VRKWLVTLTVFFAAATLFLGVLQMRSCSLIPIAPDQPVQTHTMVLKEIEGLGRMELLRFQYQDVITHEIIKDWWPDPKVVLSVQGETVGCIDFAQIDSTDIILHGDSLVEVLLPDPEICYSRLDHDKTKVFNTEYTLWEEAELVAEAYRKAEEAVLTEAIRAGILEQTREQALTMLQPLLEAISGKKVDLHFVQKLPDIGAPVE
jgi:hypothetical protein